MAEHLTDERLASIDDALAFTGVNLLGPMNDEIRSAIAELRDRRVDDLTEADRAALRTLFAFVYREVAMSDAEIAALKPGMDALNKLLSGAA